MIFLPTYVYRCGSCSHTFERFQRITDDPVEECEICSGEVQRVLFPVAVHFKGHGFYSTDYARKSTLSGNGGSGTGSAESGKSDGGKGGTAASSKDSQPDRPRTIAAGYGP